MVAPSLADLQRIFFAAGSNQSQADAAYANLLSLYKSDTSIIDLRDQAGFASQQPYLARWRSKLALSRSGGAGSLSVMMWIIGDSRVRGNASKYRLAWPDLLQKRLMGARAGSFGNVPPTEGGFALPLDADWPGGDSPWTYSAGVNGSVLNGFGLKAVSVPTGVSATITYFGDKVNLTYERTVAGPTACAVTLDGTSVGPLNARGTYLPGQSVSYGTQGDYGFHTLVMTPNDGPFVFEAVQFFDADTPFFVVGGVQVIDGGHPGYGIKDWTSGDQSNNDWSASIAAGTTAFSGLLIVFGDVNDKNNGRTPDQHKNDLITLVNRFDARLGTTDTSVAFVSLPTNQDLTAYRDAMFEAAKTLGTSRAGVIDLGSLLPNRAFGILSDDGVHPNDAGHIWVAEQLYNILDPGRAAGPLPVTPARTIIDASTLANGRTASWPDNWVALPDGGYNQSGGGTTLAEERFRMWSDAGTYRGTLTMQEDAALGNVEVYMGRWVNNTMTLTQMGGKNNVAGAPTLVTTRLATTIVNDISGNVPVVIRKTTAAGAVRFKQLIIDKIA